MTTLDPRHLSNTNKKLLHRFLLTEEAKSKDVKIKVFHPGQEYQFEGQIFSFSYPLVRRTKEKNGKKEYIYTVYDRRWIGKGGFGKVYPVLGELKHSIFGFMSFKSALHFKKKVIKVQRVVGDGSTPEMHKHESQLARLVKSTHTKKITFEKDHAQPRNKLASYMVQAWAPGDKELTQIIKENKLSIRQKILLSRNLIKALQSTFKPGVIHRDIKPGNILVNEETLEVSIVDFGLARRADTKDYQRLGTYHYSSPEMICASGKPTSDDNVDERSDIYSLGLILRSIWNDTTWVKKFTAYTGMAAHAVARDIANLYVSNTQIPVQFNSSFEAELTKENIDVSSLKRTLEGLTTSRPEDRLSLEEADRAFRNIDQSIDELVDQHPEEDLIEALKALKHVKDTDPNKQRAWEITTLALREGLVPTARYPQLTKDLKRITDHQPDQPDIQPLMQQFDYLQTLIARSESEKIVIKPEVYDQAFDELYRASISKDEDSDVTKKIKAHGRHTWLAANYALEKGWIPEEDFARLIESLKATTEYVKNPGEKFKDYCRQTTKTLGLGSDWGNYIGGIMLCGVATLVLAASIGIAIASFGIGTPFSAFGIALGSSLMIAGYTISATAFIAGTAAALGVAATVSLATAIKAGIFATEAKKGVIAVEMEELQKTRPKAPRG